MSREAVLALLRRDESATNLARRYGVTEQTLYRWKNEFLAAGEAAFAFSKSKQADAQTRRFAEPKKQIEKHDQAIGEITIPSRSLKGLSEGPSCTTIPTTLIYTRARMDTIHSLVVLIISIQGRKQRDQVCIISAGWKYATKKDDS